MTDGEGGFIEGLLQSDDGKKAVVMVGHEVYFKFRNYFPRNIETCDFIITINELPLHVEALSSLLHPIVPC